MAIDRVKVRQELAMAASGMLGVVIAVIADAVQKHDAAAVNVIGEGVHDVFGPAVPNWFVVLLLMAIGIALCFVMEPKSNKQALLVGAGVISFCMTVIPFNPPPGLSPPTSVGNAGLAPTAPPRRACAVALGADDPTDVDITLTLDPEDGKAIASAALTVLDDRGRTLGRSRFRGPRFAFSQPAGRYVLNLQVDGYGIVRCSIDLQPPAASYVLPLRPSAVPLVAQRLAQSTAHPPPCPSDR
jgi:hypothetical protein